MMNLKIFLLFEIFVTASSLSCQCSSDAGGVPCYNGWCNVKDYGGKVGACALVRIGTRQHFACVRVKPTSEDSCRVSRGRNGEQQVRCWCRENYCNTDLADRIDEDHDLPEKKLTSDNENDTTTNITGIVDEDIVIEKNYDIKDEEYLTDYVDDVTVRDEKPGPLSMTSTYATGNTSEGIRMPTTNIPPWKRTEEDLMRWKQNHSHFSKPITLSSLLSPSNLQKIQLQLTSEQRQRNEYQYVQQQKHLERTEYEATTNAELLSTTTTTTIRTTVSTTSDASFVYQSELTQINSSSPHRYENMIFDQRRHIVDEERRFRNEILRREQLENIERARAEAEAKMRSIGRNMTKPRAWLQVKPDDSQSAVNQRKSSFLMLRNYRPYDLNNITSVVNDRNTITGKPLNIPFNVDNSKSPATSLHDRKNSMVVNSDNVERKQNDGIDSNAITSTSSPKIAATLKNTTLEKSSTTLLESQLTLAESLPTTTKSTTSSTHLTSETSMTRITATAVVSAATTATPSTTTPPTTTPSTTTTTTTTTTATSATTTTASSSSATTTFIPTTIATTTTAITHSTVLQKSHNRHYDDFPKRNITRVFRKNLFSSIIREVSTASSSLISSVAIILCMLFLS